MTSGPQRYYPTSYNKPTLSKTTGKRLSVKSQDGFSIRTDSDAEDNGELFFREFKSERVNERPGHSLHSTNKSNRRRSMHQQQENQNPNVIVSYRTLKENEENAKKQQQKRYYENENKRPSNHNVLTSHMTSKVTNNENKPTLSKTTGKRISVKTQDGFSIRTDSDAEDNGGLFFREFKSERVNERPGHSLHSTNKSNRRRSMHQQQENQNPNVIVSYRTLKENEENAKQQQQKRYYENENKRPSNRNVLTSHMTSKVTNNEKTKKKKSPCEETNSSTSFKILVTNSDNEDIYEDPGCISEDPGCITGYSSDPDDDSVDSEDNRGLCFPETESEKVSNGPARFSSSLSLLSTSKSKNKDTRKQKAKIGNILCGSSSIDICLSFVTSKMSINEETKKKHQLEEQWEASWYQGIGKPNSMYGPFEMKYWVTVDGYFRKGRGGGCGAIIRDELGKPIVAFSGISTAPVSVLHHLLQGMVEGLKLALKYQLLDIELGCNSKRAANIVSRILDTTNGCGFHGIGDASFNVVCGRCVKDLTTSDEYPTVFPLLRKIAKMYPKFPLMLEISSFSRDLNRSADFLAKLGVHAREMNPCQFPEQLKKILVEDFCGSHKHGLPFLP